MSEPARAVPVADQLAEPVSGAVTRALAHDGSTTEVRVVLQPEGLGRVHVGATFVDGRVHVEIACDSDAGAVMVRATLDGLREHLDAISGTATQLVVVHRPAEPGPTLAPGTTPGAATSASSGHGGGGSSPTPHDRAPDGGIPPSVARATPTAPDRTGPPRAGRGSDDLDLLI